MPAALYDLPHRTDRSGQRAAERIRLAAEARPERAPRRTHRVRLQGRSRSGVPVLLVECADSLEPSSFPRSLVLRNRPFPGSSMDCGDVVEPALSGPADGLVDRDYLGTAEGRNCTVAGSPELGITPRGYGARSATLAGKRPNADRRVGALARVSSRPPHRLATGHRGPSASGWSRRTGRDDVRPRSADRRLIRTPCRRSLAGRSATSASGRWRIASE